MLSTAYDHLIEMNPSARPVPYGQDINPRSYAMCKSDMIIKGQGVDNIHLGDTLTNDGHAGRHFDFLLSNPRSAWSGGGPSRSGHRGARGSGPCRAFRSGPAPGVRRVTFVSAAPDLEDAAGPKRRGWQPSGHGPQRLAAVHRRRGIRRVEHKTVDHRKRPARRDHRAADRQFSTTPTFPPTSGFWTTTSPPSARAKCS